MPITNSEDCPSWRSAVELGNEFILGVALLGYRDLASRNFFEAS